MKKLAILVAGGPAPGINAVIAAATIEARNRGLQVLGCYNGFRWLVQGDTQHVVELDIGDVSRIHFEGGSILLTSRTNPTRSPDGVRRVAETLQRLGVQFLLTLGGDDTAFAAAQIAKALPGITVAHVPKTIDNDLPLPADIVTFGFTTACNLGKDLVRNLMQDAVTTERWFFVTVMGRHAGHLALGIGGAAGATLTLIAEEFPPGNISLDRIRDVIEGAIIKRRAQGRERLWAQPGDLYALGTIRRRFSRQSVGRIGQTCPREGDSTGGRSLPCLEPDDRPSSSRSSLKRFDPCRPVAGYGNRAPGLGRGER
ncbi:MAG: 6-phosphofructokinase [Planctomycetes bacterium]|nr:6-phosphofructokinase [Planctomycetota bacterium]